MAAASSLRASTESAWSAGRSVPSTGAAAPVDASERERDTGEHPLQLRHEGGPYTRDHEDSERDQDAASDEVHGADVPTQERHRTRRPPEAEGEEDERDAESQRVRD